VPVPGDEHIDTCRELQSHEIVVVGIERMDRRGRRSATTSVGLIAAAMKV
jgi:hypothetical protein